jgi:hypothetical protein
VLGRAHPVSVKRLDVPGVRLAAPADEEGFGRALRLVHQVLRDLRQVGAAGGLGDEREQLHADPADVLAGLLRTDVEQRPQPPGSGERGRSALHVHPHVTGAGRELVRRGRGQPRVEGVIDEQPPDVAEGHVADEFLDVHAPVAERAALLVGFGDLGLECHDAFETWLEV